MLPEPKTPHPIGHDYASEIQILQDSIKTTNQAYDSLLIEYFNYTKKDTIIYETYSDSIDNIQYLNIDQHIKLFTELLPEEDSINW
jgi:hypothetical protein